jgi:crotonobetainyl-CoA:carnitine CoA-transferase CaiB-like acyl-CoA transferase
MSNLNPLFQDLSFDPDEVSAVNQAYDLACQTLQNIGQLEVDREIIARGILQAAESRRAGRQQTMRACHPWIDRVRLSAAGRLKQHRTNWLRCEDGDTKSDA